MNPALFHRAGGLGGYSASASDRIAKIGYFLTLEEPTKPMRDEAASSGVYHSPVLSKTMSRIQIVTVREILEEGKRMELPMAVNVVKTAPSKKQQSLDLPF